MRTLVFILFAFISGLPAHAASRQVADTCSGVYPSFWQDPRTEFKDMWAGQDLSNAPTEGYSGKVFKLSDDVPRQAVDDKANQPWRAAKFNALFDDVTSQKKKKKLAQEYARLVMQYVLAGNINQPGKSDFDVCRNPVRPWYHMPFQTYDALSGREFISGLTREAPASFSIQTGTGIANTTMWAIAIYNATAAYTLGTIWQPDGSAKVPTANIAFDEGAVIAKPLFNTATLEQLPILLGLPRWHANISDPAFCTCVPKDGANCSLVEVSQQCPRNHAKWGDVTLLQFDIAVRDHRSKQTGWVFGTFVADGQRKQNIKEPWHKLSLLGLMWGNDTPPAGQLAFNYPLNPRKNGFRDEVVFWNVVDELNRHGGSAKIQRLGHLGSNFRLNGPADNANSSCMSCHGTASVPDLNFTTPPLLPQFSNITKLSVAPYRILKKKGLDRTGVVAREINSVPFSAIDALYFANTEAGASFNTMAKTARGDINILGKGTPAYPDPAQVNWLSLDYSLQLSISLQQWLQWQSFQKSKLPADTRTLVKPIRRNQ